LKCSNPVGFTLPGHRLRWRPRIREVHGRGWEKRRKYFCGWRGAMEIMTVAQASMALLRRIPCAFAFRIRMHAR
jgi:hypothetical protein